MDAPSRGNQAHSYLSGTGSGAWHEPATTQPAYILQGIAANYPSQGCNDYGGRRTILSTRKYCYDTRIHCYEILGTLMPSLAAAASLPMPPASWLPPLAQYSASSPPSQCPPHPYTTA